MIWKHRQPPHRRRPPDAAFHLIIAGLLGLALLITLFPDLNPPQLIPKALAAREPATRQVGMWMTYANGDAIQALAVQGDDLWAGTYLGGLVRWNTADQTVVQYLYPQSGLPGNDVRAVDIDELPYRQWRCDLVSTTAQRCCQPSCDGPLHDLVHRRLGGHQGASEWWSHSPL